MKRLYFLLFLFGILLTTPPSISAQRKMEKLDRGLVAVKTSTNKVFISWRVMGYDAEDVAFNLYRGTTKLNETPITGATNYTDTTSDPDNQTYTVKTVIDGNETGETCSASVWVNKYLEIPLDYPAAVTLPDNNTYSYTVNDCSTGDVDGDGEYEIIVKWDCNAQDNSKGGYTGDVLLDVYKMNGTKLHRINLGKNIRAGAHYTQFMVADFDGDGKAEIACKTAPGTKDGTGNFLSKGPAASANHSADYRTTSGYILSGPEYLSVFSGETGEELATVNYIPARGTVSNWGDNYGNRVDRFLACVAYLDGVYPSIVMCRGYYTRAVLAAFDFRNGELTHRWTYDSGTSNVGAYGQGNHNLSVADVDFDGKDEIIWGSCAFDDNGKLMYRTGLGHGDAMHVSNMNPDRKGYEVWCVHESTSVVQGSEMHDAATGKILWYVASTDDVGRGAAADIVPDVYGIEAWSSRTGGVYSATGTLLYTKTPSMNFVISWDGDDSRELLDGTTITKYNKGSISTLFTASGCISINSTKSNPSLSADILGDWREEVIYPTSDNKKLRIFTTTHTTERKLYTLMHDDAYRNAIAWQNVSYNQPPHPSFYMGAGMQTPPASPAYNDEKRWVKGNTSWDTTTASWTDKDDNTSTFQNNDGALFDLTIGENTAVEIKGNLTPSIVNINTPYDVSFSGDGTLSGKMALRKTSSGNLTLNNDNSYTGTTKIWNGNFYSNGNLSNSEVEILAFVQLGGIGTFGNNVSLARNTAVNPGKADGETGKLTFNNLKETGRVAYTFDINASSNDRIDIQNNWTLSGNSTFNIHLADDVSAGDYVLVYCGGTIEGDINALPINGIDNLSYRLINDNGNITLQLRKPSLVVWKGNESIKWDISNTENWLNSSSSTVFTQNDSVVFDENSDKKTVSISEAIKVRGITFDATSNYSFTGTGTIGGVGSLTKNGSGKVIISNANTFTGKATINEGIIETKLLTNKGLASGIGAGNEIEFNGGRLNYTGTATTTNKTITLGEKGGTISASTAGTLTHTGNITGSGLLTKEGSGQLLISGKNTFSGGLVLNAGTVSLINDAANTGGLGTGDIALNGGTLRMFDSSATATNVTWNISVSEGKSANIYTDSQSTIDGKITGAGTLNYYTSGTNNSIKADLSEYTGLIYARTSNSTDGSYFMLNNATGIPNGKINLAAKVSMMYYLISTDNIVVPIGDLTGASTSVLGAGGTTRRTIFWEIGGLNLNSTFNGVISNAQRTGSTASAGIIKTGTGTWTLTNANTFKGGTTINQGILKVNNTSRSGLGTGTVVVNNGGTLVGKGAISGATTINAGGILNPGDGIGTFTAGNVDVLEGGVLVIEIDKATNKIDKLVTTGTLNMAGVLQLIPSDGTTFALGDEFSIIDGTITGKPTEIIPATPGDGLYWSLNNSTGILKVTNTPSSIDPVFVGTNIFPTPCRDYLTISLGQSFSSVQITVYSAIGSMVYNENFGSQSNIEMDVNQWTKGVYMLQIKADNKTMTQKIIKE